MLKDLDHPFGRGERVYDVTFENVQAGGTDLAFISGWPITMAVSSWELEI